MSAGRAEAGRGVDHDRPVAGAQRRDRGPGSRGGAAGAGLMVAAATCGAGWGGLPALCAAAEPGREPARGSGGGGAIDPAALPRGRRGGRAVGPAAGRARGAGAVCPRLFRGPRRDRAGALVSRCWSSAWPTPCSSDGVAGRAAVRRGVRVAGLSSGGSAALAGLDRRIGALLVAGRADLLCRAGGRLGAVRDGGAVPGGSWSWLRLFPWMRSILANYETANFSELLGLLLEHQRALSRGARPGRRVDRRRAADGGRPSTGRGDRAAASIRRRRLGTVDRANVPADDALGPGDRAGAGLAGAALRNLADALPQARPVSRPRSCRCSCRRS